MLETGTINALNLDQRCSKPGPCPALETNYCETRPGLKTCVLNRDTQFEVENFIQIAWIIEYFNDIIIRIEISIDIIATVHEIS